MTAATCPNRETLLGYLTGTISESLAEGIAEHLNHCARCEQTVRELETHGDTVMAALRQSARNDAPAAGPDFQRVLERLHQMKPGAAEPAASHGSPAAAEKPRQAPTLGDYELLKKLGQGGMGTVYKARHKKLKRIVALKVLPKDRLRNAEAVARFEREMEAVGRLDHPHIVRATDAREIGGVHFLVMEYVEGFDLAQIVGRCGALSIADACEVIRQAALGLQCSHENGLVHRDIKPSNLMLTTAGEVKVLDLGLAQIQQAEGMGNDVTGIGRIMGTPDYISPEQASDSHGVDIRTDIYSLGCSLYHMLAGHPPFTGPKYDSPMKRVTAHIYEEIPPIEFVRKDVPKPVAALIARMLAKDVQTRPQTPSAVVDALAVFCEGSKLIGLLREARQQGSPDSDQVASHVNTGELRASAEAETSRDALQRPPCELPEGEPLDFDPYHRWLAIPPSEQPPNRYRLLGLAMFENDREVIRDAAARQMAHVRTYHLGQRAELSQRILNELAAAKIFLLAPEKKAAYDAELRKGLSAAAVEPPPPPESPVQEQKLPEQAVRETAEERSSAVVQLRRQAARFGSAIAKLREPAARGKAWLRTPPGITTMIASSLTALVLGAVIAIETNYGTVKIEIAEGISGVEVKLDGETISIEGLDHLLRIRPGEHDLSVVAEGFETYCRSFTVKRGGNPALAVTLVPLVGKTAITPSESIASTAAEHELPPQDRGGGGGAERIQNGSTRSVVEANATPAAIDQPASISRLLGYTIWQNPRESLKEVAGHTNFVVDCGWTEYGNELIKAARAAGLTVLMAIQPRKGGRETFEKSGIPLARENRDVVTGVYWINPYFTGHTPSEVADFGRGLKDALPGIQLWCLFVTDKIAREPVPKEVDILGIDLFQAATKDDVLKKSEDQLPPVQKAANGRPIALHWSLWDRNPPGLIERCQPGAISACAEVVERLGLIGLDIGNYGSSDSGIVGLQARPELVDEVKRIAQRWGIPESRKGDKMGAAEAHLMSPSPAREDDRPEPRLSASVLSAKEAKEPRQFQAMVAIPNVCALPNLTVLRDGTIIATIFNQPSHGEVEGDVECCASEDGGQTWQKRGTPAAHEPNTARINAAAGLAKNGDLIVIASGWSNIYPPGKKGAPFRAGVLDPWVCRSSDGGRRWSVDKSSFSVRTADGAAIVPFGDIVAGKDGSLRVAAYLYNYPDCRACVFRSTSDGRKWADPVPIDPNSRLSEAALLHLGEGRWLAATRVIGRDSTGLDTYLALYRSTDDCRSWQPPVPVTGTMQHPGHFLRLRDGRILLSYGNRTSDNGIEVCFSSDEGSTWSEPLRLADFQGNGGFPSSVQLPNGQILTAYYAAATKTHPGYHMGTVTWSPPQSGGPLTEPLETSRAPNTLSDAERAEGWKLLFDGKSLDDWKRPVGDAQFRVDEGAIVGMTHTGMKKTFLCREEGIEDFLLELDFKIDEGMNSGVQIRSQRNANEISGYQVEIDSSGKAVTGAIFDEGRRNIFLGEVTDRDAAGKAFRAGEWNSLYVSAVGDDIKTSLNGIQIAQVTDSASRSGLIGLQLHSMDSGGTPKQIRFRNIRMKSLPSTPPPATSATKEKPESPRMPNTLTYAERAEGWRLLFDGKSLSGWQGSAKHYGVVDGKLVSDFGPKVFTQREGGELFTRRQYDDFVLRFEFRVASGGNSGMIVRASGAGIASRTGMEVQILDDTCPEFAKIGANRPWMMTGAIAGVLAPRLRQQRAAGEWNSMEITCEGRSLRVAINGAELLNADLDLAARHPADGEDHPGLRNDRGYIGLHGYGSRGRVEYRDIRIKEIRP